LRRQVLVNGGTGVIGGAIVAELKRLDFDVTSRGKTQIQEGWDCDNPWGMVCAFGTYGPKGKFADLNLGQWLHSFVVNLHMQVAQVHAFANKLNGRPGRIVLLSGAGIGSGKHPAERTAYTVCKGALVHFVEAVAPEMPNIAINAVAPGAVKSRLNPDPVDPVSPELCARMVGWLMTGKNVPTGRLFAAKHDQHLTDDSPLIHWDANYHRQRTDLGTMY